MKVLICCWWVRRFETSVHSLATLIDTFSLPRDCCDVIGIIKQNVKRWLDDTQGRYIVISDFPPKIEFEKFSLPEFWKTLLNAILRSLEIFEFLKFWRQILPKKFEFWPKNLNFWPKFSLLYQNLNFA